jgi:ribosomal protein S15P/S13E
VRYDAVNAMLLNEFLKEHRRGDEQDRQLQKQQEQIENLTAQLKKQAAEIQKVNDKVEMSRPAPRTVENNQ